MNRSQSINDQSPSEQLYAACQSERSELQAAAYEVLWRYLYRVAAHMTRLRPDGDALAQDCAQIALTRVHERLADCHEPAALRSWSRRIVSNLVIDRLRRQKRLEPLEKSGSDSRPAAQWADTGPTPDELAERLDEARLLELLEGSPMSDRSKRVVIGRFFEEVADEQLAARESESAAAPVKPSHIQVTRAKNIAKLRTWPDLFDYLGKVSRL